MQRLSRIPLWAAGLLPVLLLAACQSEPDYDPSLPRLTGGMDSQLTGELVEAHPYCVLVKSAEGQVTAAVLPPQATLKDGDFPLTYQGKTFNKGDQIEFGGGMRPVAEGYQSLDSACKQEDEIFAVNHE